MLKALPPHRNKDESRAKLRNAEFGAIEQLPMRHVAELAQLVEYRLAIGAETCRSETLHILEHDRSRLRFLDQTKSLGEQVTFVVRAELLPRDAKRRARNTAGKKIDPPILLAVHLTDVTFVDIPSGPVKSQCRGRVSVDLHGELMLKPSLLQAQRLPTGPRADLKNTER